VGDRRASRFVCMLAASSLIVNLGQAAADVVSMAYVTNPSADSVAVVDTQTNTVVARIPVRDSPGAIAVNSAGTRAYVTNFSSGTVSVIDTASDAVVAEIPVGGLGSGPASVAVNPAGSRAYVSSAFFAGVSVIDTATNTVVANVGTGSFGRVILDPSGARAYAASLLSQMVSVIDTATNTVVKTMPVGNGVGGIAGLAVSPTGNRLYLSMGPNSVVVLDTGTNAVVATIAVGTSPGGLVLNPSGTHAYVANSLSTTVSVIDTATNTVVATIDLGSLPLDLAMSVTGARVYVTGSTTASLLVIDTATNTVVATVPGAGAGRVAVAAVRRPAITPAVVQPPSIATTTAPPAPNSPGELPSTGGGTPTQVLGLLLLGLGGAVATTARGRWPRTM
jgi:YVTN family beta-propeller protein